MSLLETIFKQNDEKIKKLTKSINSLDNGVVVSGLTYGFVECTLTEAQAFATTTLQYRHITDARKSGEGAGLGTGLPAFYDTASSSWVDFSGSVITV